MATTLPGTRGATFYVPATTDPAAVAVDEATKDVLNGAPDAAVPVVTPYSDLITVPVLVALGQ